MSFAGRSDKNQLAPLIPGLVSIIVPCYNIDQYLDLFINSIIDQTYVYLEIILVNDGANEATTALLRSAVPRLEAEGYAVKLIEQENKGLGGALDTGLKHFTGEFLTWPDPDDWLYPNSIEARVALLRENPDVGLLRTNADLYIDSTGEFDGSFMDKNQPPRRPAELFEDLLFLRYFYAPVCHMVRSAMFLDVHRDRSIYFDKRSSQNFQLLVPFVERYPVLQVHESFAAYRVRDDSRSRAPNASREKLVARMDQLLDLAEATLPKLKTYSPEGLDTLRNLQWRERMLPVLFRGRMTSRAHEIIVASAISTGRKRIAHTLLTANANGTFQRLDVATGRVASRALARAFDRMVAMPASEQRWPGGPALWASGERAPPVVAGAAPKPDFPSTLGGALMRCRTALALRTLEARAYLADRIRSRPVGARHILIFAQGRSGTTLLESLLVSTGHFVGHHEALNTYTREVLAPASFVRGLGRMANGRNVVVHVKGVHLGKDRKYPVDAAAFLAALHAEGWTIVHIVREGVADQVLSECLALKRGGYHKTDDRPEELRIRVEPNEFLRRYEQRLRFRAEDEAALAGLPRLTLTYEEDLADPVRQQATVTRILDAVGLAHRPARTSLKRIAGAAPAERLANINEVREALAARGIAWGRTNENFRTVSTTRETDAAR